MDSRDSPSMSVASDDDAGALSLTAKEASLLFNSDKFGDCVDVLNRLLLQKQDDPKILHNIAVAEFLRDGCSDPKKLIEVLLNVKRKSEDLTHASREQTDSTAQAAKKSILGANGTNNLASVVFPDEFDASVAALNSATVLFHLHEYSKALSVLEPLFQNIEPIDETIALHICLLLLDVAFVTQDASKFSDVINYLEKAFGVGYMLNQVDTGNIAQQQVSNLVGKYSSISNNSSVSDDLTEGTAAGSASEISLSRTLSDETMEYETLLSTLDISGQKISRPSSLASPNISARTLLGQSPPSINLKLQLPLYKIQLLLLTRNLKAAKREVKLAMNIVRGMDSSRTLLLKSQLEYARGNYPKAFKLLRASCTQADVGSSIVINNNIGCIYYQQGKHHTSSIFFHKALSNCSSLWKEKPRKLAIFSQDKSLLIAYNCGVQYLACGKPLLAAHCLWKASLVLYNKPLLWLRLAECCLMAVEKGLLRCMETSICESELRVRVIGQGKWRQLALENGSLRKRGGSSNGKVDLTHDSNIKPKLSMSFARQCLLNALHVLGCFESKHVKSDLSSKPSMGGNESGEATSSKNLDPKILSSNDLKFNMASSGQVGVNGYAREQRVGSLANSMSEYEDIYRRENRKVKQAVLVYLAFVELELGNPLKAFSTALFLLKLPDCSKMYSFLGHVYSAEALCLLNRPIEAAKHLFTYLSGENSVDVPYSEEDCRQWQAKKSMDAEESNTGHMPARVLTSEEIFLSPEEARGTLYVNLASMFIIQGDLEQAIRYAKQALSTLPDSQDALLMVVYLELKLGNAKEALTKLKKCCRLRFLPLSSSSKTSL